MAYKININIFNEMLSFGNKIHAYIALALALNVSSVLKYKIGIIFYEVVGAFTNIYHEAAPAQNMKFSFTYRNSIQPIKHLQ